ncbi:MAG: bifunctional oligoribonuclease/PAP phosphatase NrnA [Clostridia bacterium]|nr:bifunctional oligoribonuclease/PAP phosphatase NrnA [Clostridia bacterium]
MRNEDTFHRIVEALDTSEKLLIFPHIIPDGDTIGSAAALYKALMQKGKDVYVLVEEMIPEYLQFLSQGFIDEIPVDFDPDLCIALDCSDIGRMGARFEAYSKGGTTINIDHHLTNTFFGDLNYVDDQASATGEIVFNFLKALNTHMDKFIAEALYTAISTDTGSFKYTNTTKNTHYAAAELLDNGVDLNHISVELYQNVRLEKIRLEAKVLDHLSIFCNGKAVLAYVSQEMLAETNAKMDETEGIVETLRNIQGVEIAVLFKEMNDNEIKVGFRAKRSADVSKIAMMFGGGGHVKAAGCSIFDNLKNAQQLVSDAIINYFNTME